MKTAILILMLSAAVGLGQTQRDFLYSGGTGNGAGLTNFPPNRQARASGYTLSGYAVIEVEDGIVEAKTYIKPLLDAHGVVGNVTVLGANFPGGGTALTPTELLALQSAGWEVVNGTSNHLHLNSQTAATVENEINGAWTNWTALGFNLQDFSWPFSEYSAATILRERQHSRGAIGGAGGVNTAPINSDAMTYVALDYATNLSTWKSQADAARTNNGLVIFLIEMPAAGDSSVTNAINDLLDYMVYTNSMAVGRIMDGLAIHANPFDGPAFRVSDAGDIQVNTLTSVGTNKSTGLIVGSGITATPGASGVAVAGAVAVGYATNRSTFGNTVMDLNGDISARRVSSGNLNPTFEIEATNAAQARVYLKAGSAGGNNAGAYVRMDDLTSYYASGAFSFYPVNGTSDVTWFSGVRYSANGWQVGRFVGAGFKDDASVDTSGLLTVTTTGVGISKATPSAKLDVAGGAFVQSLTLTNGTYPSDNAITNGQAMGSLWFGGTSSNAHSAFIDYYKVVRSVVAAHGVVLTDVTVTNSATATTNTVIYTVPMAANYLTVGKVLEPQLDGVIWQNSNVGTFPTLQAWINQTNLLLTIPLLNSTSITAGPWQANFRFTVRAIGNSAQLMGKCLEVQSSTSGGVSTSGLDSIVTPVTFDSTVNNTITITVSNSVAGGGGNCSVRLQEGRTVCIDSVPKLPGE